MFRTFLAHLFPTTFAPYERRNVRRARRKPGVAFRPQLEALDGRIVPAVYWWSGSESTDPTDSDNWVPPDGGDPLPDQYDTLMFGPEGNVDCVGLTSPGTSFAGIIVGEGYTGTVSLGESLTLGELSLAGGAISQPTSGRELTVTDTFTWTGGPLNSSSYLSTLTLDGATATIAPASGGTVYLGSNITLTNGAVATMGEGAIDVTNEGMVLDIQSNCGVDVDPGANNVASLGVTFGAEMFIKQNAYFKVLTGSFTQKGIIENLGGKFTLLTNTTASISGLQGVANSYYQSSGTTSLYAGSTLESGRLKIILFQGGKLYTVGAGTGADAATIRLGMAGFLTFEAGDLYINSGPEETSFQHVYGTLKVEGDVQWTGGTYHPYVPAEHSGWVADLWYATGTFRISKSGMIPPGLEPVALDDEDNVVNPTSGDAWTVLKADGGFTEVDTPSYDTNIWIIDRVGNPVTEWKVKAK